MEPLTADLVFFNGIVYTADARNTICQAAAVQEDKIIFAGSNEQAANYLGAKTQKIDLQGQMLLPGFIDSHLHSPGLALHELYEVQLFGISTLEGYQNAVRNFISRRPEIKAVFGQGWIWGAFQGEEARKGPRKEYLDVVAPDLPVLLRAMDGHTWWCNSKAFEVSGLTKDTPSPEGGSVEKDAATGELWGTVKESALSMMIQPQYTLENYVEGLLAFQKKMHSLGITGVLSIMGRVNPLVMEAWRLLARQGQVVLHVRGAVALQPPQDARRQLEQICQMREQCHSPFFQITTVKMFADGVVEGGTSYLLEPYAETAGLGCGYCGKPIWDSARTLGPIFAMVNEAGLQIHVHSTGDAATRMVLDALAEAAASVPVSGCRNAITHLQLVAPEDVPRFKQLGVVASVQPYWHFKAPNWWHNVDYRLLGERANREYPLQSFIRHGVLVASSSDYTTTSVPNPLFAIETGATRNIYSGAAFGLEDITDIDDERYLLNKKERASVLEMIRSFTINGAYALFLDSLTGSIEAGKQADLVVLDQNLLAVHPLEIDKVQVMMTFFAGKLVYSK